MRLCGVWFILFFAGALHAQNTPGKHTIYLKDGSVLKGQILTDNDYFIEMVIGTGDTIKIGYKNIVTNKVDRRLRDKKPIVKSQLSSGPFGLLGIGISPGDIGAEADIRAIAGWRISSRWNIGVASSFSRYNVDLGNVYADPGYITLSPYARYYLKSEGTKPFISLSPGVAFPLNNQNFDFYSQNFKRGFYLRNSAGVHFASGSKYRFLLEGGVKYLEGKGEVFMMFEAGNPMTTTYRKKYIQPYLAIAIEF